MERGIFFPALGIRTCQPGIVPVDSKGEFTHYQDIERPALNSPYFEFPRSKKQPHEERD